MGKALRGLLHRDRNQFEVILALCQGAGLYPMDEPFAGNDVFNREDFYKVLLGILEPEETVLLSTHLLEEVQHFIGRAVLLHQGGTGGGCDHAGAGGIGPESDGFRQGRPTATGRTGSAACPVRPDRRGGSEMKAAVPVLVILALLSALLLTGASAALALGLRQRWSSPRPFWRATRPGRRGCR